ncbi:hypothetical protein J7E50_10910 [Pedobacter sp. ISL-68]|uniref:hypothetical protein n=1 Tax=unclassified Pedobacter TaxID=2628915 RepID=UPI001BE53E4C|nr:MULTISPECIES: hypothetical protein [unclassified Pedobacter]MBT2561342.1 hypothetical protein [Pedobacter sp. ISL-64]MBT2590731.1 hypothetical protein [Pedobacter sp. ISL-68]
MDAKQKRKPSKTYTKDQKYLIVQDYLTSGWSKQAIWEKHTGELKEHGKIVLWMRKLGYDVSRLARTNRFADQCALMEQKKSEPLVWGESVEQHQMQKRIEFLEGQLKDEELKAIAFSRMVDIAEREFKIPIRKKFNTKP